MNTNNMTDPIIDKLKTINPDIDFTPATDGVIEGHDLKKSGNQSYGKDIYVATHSAPHIDLSMLKTGKEIAVGTSEDFRNCELRCYRSDASLCIALFKNDKPISRILKTASEEDTVDEALFTWLGPAEDICTPWSDNDPPQCQVITVDVLRDFAGKRSNNT